MLHHRDSRDGTIDLSGAHPSGLAQLLAGRSTRLSSLLRDPEVLSDARRRARSIRQKAERLASDRGINTAHLAIGFATWTRTDTPSRTEYSAPVLLRHVTLVPRGTTVEDYEVALDADVTVNPALVSYLEREHGIEIDVAEWVAATGGGQTFDPHPVYERLRAVTKGVAGVLVNQRYVIGTFANIVTPFTTDELPAAHPMLRALAGEKTARVGFGGPVAAQASVDHDARPTERIAGDPAATVPIPADEAPTAEKAGKSPAEEKDASAEKTPAEGQSAAEGKSSVEPPRTEAVSLTAGGVLSGSARNAAKPEKTDTVDTSEKVEKPEKSDKTAKAGTPAKTDTAEKPTSAPSGEGASAAEAEKDPAAGEEATEDPAVTPAPTTAGRTPTPLPDRRPQEEFVAIDVDGDQQAVVDAAMAGRSVVVDTPPGTGATQVAVAVATTLAHMGRSVLYVAQNSDALDDFAARMASCGLPDFAVDGRDSTTDVHKRLISLIGSAEKAEKPDLTDLLKTLTEQRETLLAHTESLHRVREPWGVSVHSTMEHLAALTADHAGPSTPVRFDAAIVEAVPERRAELRRKLLEYSSLGAFTLDVADTVWFGARFTDTEEAEKARALAARAAKRLPGLVELAEPVLERAQVEPTRTVAAWGRALSLLLGVRRTLDSFSPDVFSHGLTDLIAATGDAEYRKAQGIEMGVWERRRLRKAAKEFLRPGVVVNDLHSALVDAKKQREALAELSGGPTRPRVPRGLLEADEAHREITRDLAQLAPYLETTPDGGDLESMDLQELQARLQALGEDKAGLVALPACTALDDTLRDAGLGALLDDLRARRVPHEAVGQEFDLAYWASVLQSLAVADPQVGGHDGLALHRVAADYRISDKKYVAAGADRLRFSHSKKWKAAIGDRGDQAKAARAHLRSTHLDVRAFSAEAPDILTSIAPVWMASPLRVPELFAAAPLFDTVVVADAGRLTVPEVLPAIARAKQVIALGDDRLLGPRDFSVTVDRRTPTPEEGTRSVFSELAEFLPVHRLHMNYRVSPPGLVDLVNDLFYDDAVTSLPTALTHEGPGLEFSYVADALGSPDTATGQVESPDAEVQRVVDLVIRHARTRSRQSLAVVTLTPWHAQRVATGIQQAIRQYPYVASFFTDASKEPFVVTDCERIHGMARDSVIFSLGYGRTLQGRVLPDFGALSKLGGERMLAAAITRARRKLTLVSCFSPEDFDRRRLAHGARLLPDLLAAVAAGGRTRPAVTGEEKDPLVIDIAQRLWRMGVAGEEDYAGIDLAVAVSHEDDQGMALAVETDGPDYARTPSLRERERLRPEILARRGWRCQRLWSTDAFVDPQSQAEKIFEVWKETVEDLSPQAVLNAARAAAVVVGRQGTRPKVTPGLPLHKYAQEDIDATVDWIQSDGIGRSDAEIKAHLRAAFAQKGASPRVERVLDSAVARYRKRFQETKRTAAEVRDLAGAAGKGSGPAGTGAAGAEAGTDGTDRAAGSAEDSGRADGDVHFETRGAAVDQAEVMPLFDTGKLREQDLLDAGLRGTPSDGPLLARLQGALGKGAGSGDPASGKGEESAGETVKGTNPKDTSTKDTSTKDTSTKDTSTQDTSTKDGEGASADSDRKGSADGR